MKAEGKRQREQKPKPAKRAELLAANLRANLALRKEQARKRSAMAKAGDAGTPDDPPTSGLGVVSKKVVQSDLFKRLIGVFMFMPAWFRSQL
jgi:hypothetical protein